MNSRLFLRRLWPWLFFLPLAAVGAPDVPTADDLQRLEQTWASAIGQGNVDQMEPLLAPEFTQVTVRRASISTVARADWLDNIRRMSFASCSPRIVAVDVYGETAVVTVDLAWVVARGLERAPDYFYITDVWVRRAGQWQVVRRHCSPYPKVALPTPPPAH